MHARIALFTRVALAVVVLAFINALAVPVLASLGISPEIGGTVLLLGQGLGTVIKPMTRGQVAQAATPPSGQASENIWVQWYDTQTYTDNTTTELQFFQQVNNDKSLSNMKVAGQLPSGEPLRIHNITVDMWTALGVSTSATTTGNLDDLSLLLMTGRPRWTLTIDNKSYGPYKLTALHGTGGPTGFGFSSDGAEILQWAKVDCSPGWNYHGQLIIPELTSFQFTIRWAAAQNLTADWLICVSLFGAGNQRVR